MLDVAHFYHLWADGEWREPATEHFDALVAAGWRSQPVYVGIVGAEQHRREVEDWLEDNWCTWSAGGLLRRPSTCAWADEGFEHGTLNELHRYAQGHDGAVMYAHTKGAYDTALIQHVWRRYMTEHLVGEWQRCRTALEQGYDVAGPCYLPGGAAARAFGFLLPIFGGNFWMATCEYLRSLPPLESPGRHEAEVWVCQKFGRAFSTAPFAGW